MLGLFLASMCLRDGSEQWNSDGFTPCWGLSFSYVNVKDFQKELNRTEQAERRQVRFGVDVIKEIHLRKTAYLWLHSVKLGRGSYNSEKRTHWQPMALSNSTQEQKENTNICWASSGSRMKSRQKGTLCHHIRKKLTAYILKMICGLGLCISRRTWWN